MILNSARGWPVIPTPDVSPSAGSSLTSSLTTELKVLVVNRSFMMTISGRSSTTPATWGCSSWVPYFLSRSSSSERSGSSSSSSEYLEPNVLCAFFLALAFLMAVSSGLLTSNLLLVAVKSSSSMILNLEQFDL